MARKRHPASKREKEKIRKVMNEFKRGQLKSSSGEKATDIDQAIAIALSEARRLKRKKGDDRMAKRKKGKKGMKKQNKKRKQTSRKRY